jgi:phage tail-like protein
MASTGKRDDPYAAFNFIVSIGNIPVAGFSECSGLSNESAVIEYRNGNEVPTNHKLPGLLKYTDIELKRGFTDSLDLWNWRKAVLDGATVREEGSITLHNEAREPVLRWNFQAGWPSKWDGPALGAGKNEVAIEGLRISHEGMTMETV